jgi:hypothetical protein
LEANIGHLGLSNWALNFDSADGGKAYALRKILKDLRAKILADVRASTRIAMEFEPVQYVFLSTIGV